ncbi:Fc receptor-like protein 1 isoform X1 [Mugil cephalus]|uniref:Fc receptor-like protein 1 isoform X1 n=1 Tax=Mugil cephalus TaxID=48193 RepID=UPI001FB81CBB|nr:Fc receptor-like protein 1 isoform X1 [Mugil cephalus]
MEVRAFCIALLTVMILLCAEDQEVDAAFLRISPNRLQFFEYESVTLFCDGVFFCDVERKSILETPSCCTTDDRTSTGPTCTTKYVYQDDSGKYWCEEGGQRRNIININVTSGSLILESPALPVMEGEDVILSCRTKKPSSNITVDFYKDGVHKWRSTTGNMSLKTVSMSDQGFYKCNISGVGESPQSWMSVRVSGCSSVDAEDHKDSYPPCSLPPITPWIIIAILLMLLLLVVGRHHFGRFACSRDASSWSQTVPDSRSSDHQTVSVQASAPAAIQPMYATVTKTRKKNDKDGASAIYHAFSQNGSPQQAAESSIPSVSPVDSDVHYSTIQDVAKC